MKIRENWEQLEVKILSEFGSKSIESQGREREEELCNVRTIYQQDRDRIIHCKSFRRLKHKTQVFISSDLGDHRTRLTHTLDVSQISRTIARGLRLNEDLTEAISLGHDLGHTPFGHAGEEVLNSLSEYGFKHNEQSLRVVEKLERKGLGLNLTKEVRDGILHHTGKIDPYTVEGKLVKISDRIAYINHDIDDGIRSGILKIEEIPKEFVNVLGHNHSDRINTLVMDIIKNSYEKNDIIQSKEVSYAMLGLRKFLFQNFYLKDEIKKKFEKSNRVLESLYNYFMKNPKAMGRYNDNETKERNVLDYISGMTDRYAIHKFKEIFLPE